MQLQMVFVWQGVLSRSHSRFEHVSSKQPLGFPKQSLTAQTDAIFSSNQQHQNQFINGLTFEPVLKYN